jgi:F-type H+-transporting ATPase subunit gamma
VPRTREIRKRIGSVRNIHKITHTMERVAQSKGMKLQGRYERAKSFRADLLRLVPEALGAAPGTLQAAQELASHDLGAPRPAVKTALLFCVTSSRGLCGGYNAKVIQAARARSAELAREGIAVTLGVMGKKGLAYWRYHQQPVAVEVPDADENIPFVRVAEVARDLAARYARREVDAVEVIATRWRTKVQQEVRRDALLPLRAEALAGAPARGPETAPDGRPLYLVEAGRPTVLAALLPLLVEAQVFCDVLEAMLCEQSQRSMAMRNASDNAESMTKQLTRTYNRARQAQITNEMIEIVSGSEGGR